MGKILTKSQWAKRKDKGDWSYSRYRDWRVKAEGRKNANTGAGGSDVFAPISFQAAQARAAQLFPYRGGPILGDKALQGQAGTYVQGMIDPLIQQLTASITQRAKTGSESIRGFTDAYMGRLGQIGDQTVQGYDRAKAEQGAIESALGSVIRDRSNNTLGELGGTLQQIGGEPSKLGALAQGVAGEQAALGASGLSNLVSDAASATAYSRQLPGIAALQGQQNLSMFNQDLNTKLDEGTGEIRAQIPSLVQNVYQNLLARQMQQRQMLSSADSSRASLVDAQLARNLQAALGKAGLEYDYSSLSAAGNPPVDGSSAAADGPAALSPQDRASLRQNAAKDAFELAANLASAHIDPTLGTVRDGVRPAQYNEVQRQVYEQLKAQLEGYVDDKVIRSMARSAVRAAGLFPKPKPQPSVTGKNTTAPTGRADSAGKTNAKGQRPQKPKNHPGAMWRESGPAGPGWYIHPSRWGNPVKVG